MVSDIDKYQTLFDQLPEAVVVLDPETALPVAFNQRACRQFGYTREELSGVRLLDRTTDSGKAILLAAAQAGPRDVESEVRTKNGEILDCSVTVSAVVIAEQQLWSTVWREISEQKRANAEVQRREAYYRALTELGSDLVLVLAADGRIRYLSPSVTRVLGYEPGELLNRNALELLHREDELVARDSLQRARVDVEWRGKIEVRVRHHNGTWRVVEVAGRNLLDDANVAGIIVNGRDITERKQAETRIREQAALLEKAQDAILVCDLESTILYWSQSAARVYGWTAQEALGKRTDQLMAGTPEAWPIAAFKGLIAKGDWKGELLQRSRSGHEITVESRWSLVRGDDGEPKSILIINTDVTETRKLQAQFLRAQRMESIGALAGGIAHDLNNVLSPILITAELLHEKLTDPECRQWLDMLSDSARRGAEVVRQILAFARGTGEELVQLQVRHLIREHEKILKETLPRSISIETAVQNTLWLVKGNATKLSQVLMNLSVNARDAMPAGGKIRIRAWNLTVDDLVAAARPELKPGPYVVISVTDTGSGIPHHLLSRIFEPFFTTKDVTKGTGLGLATAQGIIKSHDGALAVYSEEGKGTQFNVYLPAVQTEDATPLLLQKPPLVRGSGECVLVVDDESSTREMIAATLETHGYQVLKAADGAQGLELFLNNQQRIGLILTDVAMPVMEGPPLIRRVRARQPRLPIVVLSGLVDVPGLKEAVGWPDVHFLEKPCTAENLLNSIRRALTRE